MPLRLWKRKVFSVIVKDQDRSSAGEDADEAVKKTDENISAKTKSSRAFGGEVPDNVVVNGYREALQQYDILGG